MVQKQLSAFGEYVAEILPQYVQQAQVILLLFGRSQERTVFSGHVGVGSPVSKKPQIPPSQLGLLSLPYVRRIS